MTKSENCIATFYKAFKELDAETMVSCYHEEVQFEDPAFGILDGARAKNMWRMLCSSQQGKDFIVTISDISCENQAGKAHWEAFYTFGKTGRKVHNKIDAKFELKDGKIIRHTDRFSLYRWAKQAFGISGLLLGWTPFFRKKLQRQTNRLLDKFEQKVGDT